MESITLHTLAISVAIIGITRIGIRFYDLHSKELKWESYIEKTVFLSRVLIIAYFKLVISTLPIWSFKIENRPLRWIHNVLVVLFYVLAFLVNEKLQMNNT